MRKKQYFLVFQNEPLFVMCLILFVAFKGLTSALGWTVLSGTPIVGFLQRRCSKLFRKFHWKAPVLEYLFNKVAGLQLFLFILGAID